MLTRPVSYMEIRKQLGSSAAMNIRVKTPDWLEALLTFSLDDDVGVRRRFCDYPTVTVVIPTCQKPGPGPENAFCGASEPHIVGGPFGTAVHAWYGEPWTSETYGEWARVHKDWSMVTGAVFATRKSVLDRFGGFDGQFALEFNDLDLCLRLRLLGSRIVYTPFAELVYCERASRGPGGHAASRAFPLPAAL